MTMRTLGRRSGGPLYAGAAVRRGAALVPAGRGRGAAQADEAMLRLLRFLPGRRARLCERWVRGREEARKLQLADCVLVSWAKSGRTWLRVMLAHYYEQQYKLPSIGLLDFDNLHRQNPAVPKIFFTHGNYLVDYTRHHDSKADFYDRKVLLLVRDPRDIAVSQYFQWKYRMPAWKRKLNFATAPGDEALFDFVMAEHGLPRVVEFLNGWAQEASRIRRLHVVRYEDMRKNPARVLDQVLDYLGTPGDGEHVAAAVEFGRFDNLKELERRKAFRGGRMRPADPDNPESYKVRRGKVGGYRDYFDQQQVAVIDQLTSSTLSPFYGYPDTYPADRAVAVDTAETGR